MVDATGRRSLTAAIRAVRDEWPTEQRRPTVFAQRGMIASAHPLAAQAGLQVLAEGGNAFDAALATALVEGVVLPPMCGLGGDMFAVLYTARTGELYAINGSGAAPRAATPEYFLERGYRAMPLGGLLSASVPGAVDGYLTLHERFGSLPRERLFAPAIRLAADGFVVSPRLAALLRTGADGDLGRYPTSAAVFLPAGPPRSGDVLRQPQLARTLETVMRGGRQAFYEGAIAAAIAEFSARNGGLFTREDFAAHQTEVYRPLATTYRGLEVFTTAPPSQGLIVLEMLNLLEGFPLDQVEPCSADAIHWITEAKKIAFADRLAHCGDPRFVDIPLERLLSKAYAALRRGEIDPQRAAPLGPLAERLDGDTSYFCVVDAEGNAISFIHSLSRAWGSGVVAGETGILLNNRAGRGFSLQEGHPNRLAGGRRTMHTLHCYLVAEEGQPVLIGGTPGGDQQPQWNVQTLVSLIDHGLAPQVAVEAPRWYSFPGTDPATIDRPGELRLESRVAPAVLEELRRRGHPVQVLGPWGAGGAVQLIAIDRERGVLLGATDPRAEGVVLGL